MATTQDAPMYLNCINWDGSIGIVVSKYQQEVHDILCTWIIARVIVDRNTCPRFTEHVTKTKRKPH